MLACDFFQLLSDPIPHQHLQVGLHDGNVLFRKRDGRHRRRRLPLLPVRTQTESVDVLRCGFVWFTHDHLLRAGALRLVHLPTLYTGPQAGHFIRLQHSLRVAWSCFPGAFRRNGAWHGELCNKNYNWIVAHPGPGRRTNPHDRILLTLRARHLCRLVRRA